MGKPVSITRTDLSAAELRAAAGREKDGPCARRMLALAMVLDGSDRTGAANTCGMDRQTLRDWVHRYNNEGLEGLRDRVSKGPPSRLDAAQLAELARLVDEGPDLAADKLVRWRRTDLRDQLKARFGIEFHERSVGKILNQLGYRRLSVRPQHPRSDPTAQEAFKKTLRRP